MDISIRSQDTDGGMLVPPNPKLNKQPCEDKEAEVGRHGWTVK